MQRDIGWAVQALRVYKRVTRAGWHGKGLYLELQIPVDTGMRLPFVAIASPEGLVPWTCSQIDLLAIDWQEA